MTIGGVANICLKVAGDVLVSISRHLLKRSSGISDPCEIYKEGVDVLRKDLSFSTGARSCSGCAENGPRERIIQLVKATN